jgi:tripartite ATP-independent transporter DctP family solute receptor
MRSKYIFLIIFILVAIVSWVFLTKDQNSPTQQTRETSQEKIIKLRFGHNTPTDSALHQAALRYSKLVREKSNGRVHIEVFPAQELGNDHEMVEMARDGKLDILLTPTAKMSVPVPAMQYADLPFLFPSREDAYELLDGEPGKILLNQLRDIDLIGVTFWENGFKHFTGNTPLTSPDKFVGKKIRVMKSRIIMDQFSSLGAEPIPIDFHTTRQALADGVVDGQENPLIAIVSMGFHEVQSDLVLSEHAYLAYVFSISEKVFNQLPNSVRAILINAAKEITPWEREETQRREQSLLETIKNSGVRIHRLTEKQKQAFAQKTAYITKKFEDVIGVNLISKTEEILLKKYGPPAHSQEQIVIGINADFSLDSVSGLAIKRGVELAVNEINDQGGLLGKPIRILSYDHQVMPSKGKSNINELIKRDDLVAIIGGKHSAVIVAEIDTIQKHKIPYLIPWAAAAELTENGYADNYLFRISANDKTVSKFLVDSLLERYNSPAIVVENSVWGRGNLERMTNRLTEKGFFPKAKIIINRGQKNFEQEIESILKSNADSILLVLNANEGSRFVYTLANLAPALPIVSHWGIVGGSFVEQNQAHLAKMDLRFFQTFSFYKDSHAELNNLKQRYLDTYRSNNNSAIPAPGGVAQAYDLTKLLIAAIKQAGTVERSKIKQALENLPGYQGVIRFYNPPFTSEKHDALNKEDFFLAKFTEQGQILPILVQEETK